jgi:hypothetical protein
MLGRRRPFHREEWRAEFVARLASLLPMFTSEELADIAVCEYLWAGGGCPEAAAEYYHLRDRQAQDELSEPRRRPLRPASTGFGLLD